MHRMKAGQKPPVGSTVYLCRNTGDQRELREHFQADDNPEWVCEDTANGFWYGYETAEEIKASLSEFG